PVSPGEAAILAARLRPLFPLKDLFGLNEPAGSQEIAGLQLLLPVGLLPALGHPLAGIIGPAVIDQVFGDQTGEATPLLLGSRDAFQHIQGAIQKAFRLPGLNRIEENSRLPFERHADSPEVSPFAGNPFPAEIAIPRPRVEIGRASCRERV